MSPFHWGVLVGLFIGCFAGVVLMSLLWVAKEDR